MLSRTSIHNIIDTLQKLLFPNLLYSEKTRKPFIVFTKQFSYSSDLLEDVYSNLIETIDLLSSDLEKYNKLIHKNKVLDLLEECIEYLHIIKVHECNKLADKLDAIVDVINSQFDDEEIIEHITNLSDIQLVKV